MHAPAITKPRAYSYIRFSTPEQGRGTSFERQIEAAERYARDNDLDLDTRMTFADLGVSAFHGRNAKTGGLKAFLDAIEIGLVREGSYLLVESLDRLSRDNIISAQGLFMLIVSAGVTVVTLGDGRVYSKEGINNNPTDLIVSIAIMMRGRDESTTKSYRSAENFARKRRLLASGKALERPYTRRLPSWVAWDERERRYVLREDRAAFVRQMFALADQGWGVLRIARWMNEQKADTWGGTKRKATHWHRSYVKKILTNPAVIGTFVPHVLDKTSGRIKRIPQEHRPNLWPAAVEQDVYERVSRRMAAGSPKGKHADRSTTSIFSGLIRCAHCAGSVVRVSKGEHVYLVCSKANAKGDCRYLAVPYSNADAAVRDNIDPLIDHAPRGINAPEMDEKISALDAEVSDLTEEAAAYARELRATASPTVRAQLREADAKLTVAKESLRTMKELRERIAGPFVQHRLEQLREAFHREPGDVGEINRCLKATLERIVMDPTQGRLWLRWRDAEEPDYVVLLSRHWQPFDT